MPPILTTAVAHHHRYYLSLTPCAADRPHAVRRLDTPRSPPLAPAGCAADKSPALSTSTPPLDHPPYSKFPPARRPITDRHPRHSPRRERHPRHYPFLPLSSPTVSLEITRDGIVANSSLYDKARKIIHDLATEWADMAHTKAAVARIEVVVYAAVLGVRWSVMGYDGTMLGRYNCEEIWYFVASDEWLFRMGHKSQLPDLAPFVEAAADFVSYPGQQNDAAVKDFLDRFPLSFLFGRSPSSL